MIIGNGYIYSVLFFLFIFCSHPLLSSSYNNFVNVNDMLTTMIIVGDNIITKKDFSDRLCLNCIDYNDRSFTNHLTREKYFILSCNNLIKFQKASQFIILP